MSGSKEDTGAGHPQQHLQLPDRGHCQVNREDIDIGIRIPYRAYYTPVWVWQCIQHKGESLKAKKNLKKRVLFRCKGREADLKLNISQWWKVKNRK